MGSGEARTSSSTAGKPSASEGSSGERSGRVSLKVVASLSSLDVGSWGRSSSSLTGVLGGVLGTAG